jgi:glutaredoxin 3
MYTIYSKPTCPFCDQAKALLEKNNIPFQVIMLDVGQLKVPEEQYISRTDLMNKFPNARTVPQIMNGEEYIGGFRELQLRVQGVA